MNDILIRKARPEEAEIIAGFNQAMAMETEGKRLDDAIINPGVRAMFDHPQRGFYMIAESDRQAIASLMVTYEWSDWRNGMFWWIQSVYVRQDFRRQGIYRQMYELLKQMAKAEDGVCGFRLYAETENHTAHATYKSVGMDACPYQMFEQLID
jgi:GNAT superfamily N-acetyltransferase